MEAALSILGLITVLLLALIVVLFLEYKETVETLRDEEEEKSHYYYKYLQLRKRIKKLRYNFTKREVLDILEEFEKFSQEVGFNETEDIKQWFDKRLNNEL